MIHHFYWRWMFLDSSVHTKRCLWKLNIHLTFHSLNQPYQEPPNFTQLNPTWHDHTKLNPTFPNLTQPLSTTPDLSQPQYSSLTSPNLDPIWSYYIKLDLTCHQLTQFYVWKPLLQLSHRCFKIAENQCIQCNCQSQANMPPAKKLHWTHIFSATLKPPLRHCQKVIHFHVSTFQCI